MRTLARPSCRAMLWQKDNFPLPWDLTWPEICPSTRRLQGRLSSWSWTAPRQDRLPVHLSQQEQSHNHFRMLLPLLHVAFIFRMSIYCPPVHQTRDPAPSSSPSPDRRIIRPSTTPQSHYGPAGRRPQCNPSIPGMRWSELAAICSQSLSRDNNQT